MYIFIKNYNGHLIFMMNDQVDFCHVLRELEGLLRQPFFQKKGCYPKAFFDFGCRKITSNEMMTLLEVLVKNKTVVCSGIIGQNNEVKKSIRCISRTIHSGEHIIVNCDTLIWGTVNKDARISVYARLYILGTMQGIVCLENNRAEVSSRSYKNATICYHGEVINHYNSPSPAIIMVKNNQIKRKELNTYD